MKILDIKNLSIPEIKVIKFARFCDDRGYFTEQFRKSQLLEDPEIYFLNDVEFMQANQSSSKKGVIRGLHFQWNPNMGKLVRTLSGHMVDLVLDIREGSPTQGKIVGYDMPANNDRKYDEWIWVPEGFAHGNYFPESGMIEYMCSSEYSPQCEAGISPLSKDLDWSLCDPKLKKGFDEIQEYGAIISDKDRDAPSFNDWMEDERSKNFIYTKSENKGYQHE